MRDVGAAIERTANARGFEVFKELTGHGIGRRMHEAPTVFNWPAPQANQRLTPGTGFHDRADAGLGKREPEARS